MPLHSRLGISPPRLVKQGAPTSCCRQNGKSAKNCLIHPAARRDLLIYRCNCCGFRLRHSFWLFICFPGNHAGLSEEFILEPLHAQSEVIHQILCFLCVGNHSRSDHHNQFHPFGFLVGFAEQCSRPRVSCISPEYPPEQLNACLGSGHPAPLSAHSAPPRCYRPYGSEWSVIECLKLR